MTVLGTGREGGREREREREARGGREPGLRWREAEPQWNRRESCVWVIHREGSAGGGGMGVMVVLVVKVGMLVVMMVVVGDCGLDVERK